MGILKSSKAQDKPTPLTAKRRSVQTDFANLKPLKPGGALGFSSFRETDVRSDEKAKKDGKSIDTMDSDEEDEGNGEVVGKLDDVEVQDFSNSMLSPEDAKRQGELAEGVKKIKVRPRTLSAYFILATLDTKSMLTCHTAETSTLVRASSYWLPGSCESQIARLGVSKYRAHSIEQQRQGRFTTYIPDQRHLRCDNGQEEFK